MFILSILKLRFRILKVSLIVLTPALLSCGETHALSNVDGYLLGVVTSAEAPVESAMVTIRSLDSGVSRSTNTSAAGAYRFSRLAPGAYQITASASGYQSASWQATVNAGQGTPINFNLAPGYLEEVIVRGTHEPAIDVTSAETATILTTAEIELLPVSRDINAVGLLAPGATLGDTAFGTSLSGESYTSGFGLVSFGGASVAENVYYVNGMNVTNFRNGLGGSAIPFEFYDQFQFKTGGFGAEFGRSTGGVLNAVTRRGTDQWRIRAGYIVTPESLRSHSPNVADPTTEGEFSSVFKYDEKDSSEYFLSAGGPIIPNRLFVYGIYQGRDVDVDNYTGTGRLLREDSDDPFWGGKVDWIINDYHRIELTAFSDESTTVRSTFLWDEASRAVGENLGKTHINRGGENYIGKYTGSFHDVFTISLLAGRSRYNLTNEAESDSVCPAAYDSRGGGLTQIGCWTNFLTNAGFDKRKIYRADFEYAFNDRHLLRFGFDREENSSTSTRQYSGPDGGYFRYYSTIPGATLNNGGIVPDGVSTLVRYRIFKGGGKFATTSQAYYVEDEWSITDTITARLGLRNERFNNKNPDGDSFIKVTDQWAPRLGIAWDARGDGASRLFLNFGRYHLPIANIASIQLSGGTLFTEDWHTLGDAIAADGSVTLGDKIGDTIVISDGTVPPVEELIDTSIKPMYQDEIILGYETEFWERYRGSVTYTYRNLGRGIEDIIINEAIGLPGEFHYVLTNPGTDVSTSYDVDGDGVAEALELSAEELGFPEPVRKYHALTFTLEKSWDNGSYVHAAYTWSHSYGNYEGMVRSDNGQDDAGITTLFDFAGLVEGAYGDLPNDRRHSVKLFGVYEFYPGWQASLSAYYQDGRPRNAFGIHPTDPYAALYGPESFFMQGVATPRDSLGRTKDVINFDLGLQFNKNIGSHTMTFRVDVFNILNSDTAVEVNEVADQETGAASPTFGLPTWFQRPRAIRLSVTYDFQL